MLVDDLFESIHPFGWEVQHLTIVCLQVTRHDLLQAQHLGDDRRCGGHLACVEQHHGMLADLVVHADLFVGQAHVARCVDLLW